MPSEEEEERSHRSKSWSRYARNVYDPVRVGSIEGKIDFPHDRALVRAMDSSYKPNHKVAGEPLHMVFVGHLAHSVGEERLQELFDRFGTMVSCRLLRNIVTGLFRGYGFVEFMQKKINRTSPVVIKQLDALELASCSLPIFKLNSPGYSASNYSYKPVKRVSLPQVSKLPPVWL